MKRTLLAVGIVVVVLSSMLLAPHTDSLDWGGVWIPDQYETIYPGGTQHLIASGYWRDHYCWYWWPMLWGNPRHVAWPAFWIQTAFIALLAAVIVNLFPRRTKK